MGSNNSRVEKAIAQTMARTKEYKDEFGEKLQLPSREFAKKRYLQICEKEPYYRKAVSEIEGRIGFIINSKQFRDALAGKKIQDNWVEDDNRNYVREYELPGHELSADDKAKMNAAETMVSKLDRCLTGLMESVAGYSPVDGLQQSYQLVELLKRDAPSGNGTVLDALIQAADQIEKLENQPYKSKKNKAEEEKNANELLINVDQEEKNQLKSTMKKDLLSDLYYLDKTIGYGLDMAHRYPQSVVKPVNLSTIKSWQGYLDAHLSAVPHDHEQQKDHLAKVLVGAFQAGLSTAKSIHGGPAVPAEPFSASKAEDYVKQIKEQPAFKHACKDPTLVRDLLTVDPKQPNKHFNAMMNIFQPFGNIDPAKAKQVLEKLQKMQPYLDVDAGRGPKWKNFTKSVRTIDLNNPNQSGENKLQEIYDMACAYMKGKKSLRSDDDQQMRFDQALDVLSVLAEAGPYAKLAANSVVDRINEVRLGHDKDYETINLSEYGMKGLAQHTHVPAVKIYALDPLPVHSAFLECAPKNGRANMEPLPYAGEPIEPLYSTEKISEEDATIAIATAIALSKQRVYYFNAKKNETLTSGLDTKIKLGGRAVVNGSNLLTETFMLSRDPAIIALGKRYTNPEARKELFRNGQLGLTEKIVQGKKIKWSDTYDVGNYEKLSKAEFKRRMLDGKAANEPLEPLGENGEIKKNRMLEVTKPEKRAFKDPARIDLSRLDIGFLNKAYDEAKKGNEFHKNDEVLQKNPGLGQKNV